ncbi:MAG TPA: hypothetical protein VMJ30_10050, partial [Gemmatimonadales bacterium]|nr:hypothetical protein [Gemmatimonadales bacterium]
ITSINDDRRRPRTAVPGPGKPPRLRHVPVAVHWHDAWKLKTMQVTNEHSQQPNNHMEAEKLAAFSVERRKS